MLLKALPNTTIAETVQRIAKPICMVAAASLGAIKRADIMPAITKPTNGHVDGSRVDALAKAWKTVMVDIRAMTIKEVATILCIFRLVKRCSNGTIIKPPPTPNKPVNKPEKAPIESM